MNNSVDALRRWFGAFFLAVAAGMLIWGHTILLPWLRGTGFLIYWALCFLFTLSSIVLALLDAHAVMKQVESEQARLFERALKDIERDAEAKDEQRDGSLATPPRGSRHLENRR